MIFVLIYIIHLWFCIFCPFFVIFFQCLRLGRLWKFIYIESFLFDAQYGLTVVKRIFFFFRFLDCWKKKSVLYAMADSVRITRGINNNIQNFLKFLSFDLCITQWFAARMAQEYKMTIDSSSKKKGKCRAIKPLLINKNIEVMKYYIMTMKRY